MKKIIIIFLVLILSSCNKVEVQKTSKILKDEINTCYNIFPIAFKDLKNIENSLKELKKMQVNCIWINPIHPSDSYHKYDVKDYYQIDSEFGNLEDYKNLIKEAHKNNIYIIMDFVQNHSSINHPWFIEASKNKKSKYHDYFIFNDLKNQKNFPDHTGWHQINDEYYYGFFSEKMPEWNYENPEVRKYMKDIAKYWIEIGVDGFRIDAAKYIYAPLEYKTGTDVTTKTIEWFKEFNQFVKKENKDIFIISEIWDDTKYIAPYLEGMDAVFDFSYADMTTKMILTHNSTKWLEMIETNNQEFSKIREDYISGIFLSNHDQNRIMSTLANNIERMKLAATILFTSPNKPFIYYGEELGMLGKKPDESIREPYIWGNELQYNWEEIVYNKNTQSYVEQEKDPNSLLNHYRNLSLLREDPVLNKGKLNKINNENTNVLTYEIKYENKTYLVIHNLYEDVKVNVEGNYIYGHLENDILKQYQSIIIEVKDNYKLTLEGVKQ